MASLGGEQEISTNNSAGMWKIKKSNEIKINTCYNREMKKKRITKKKDWKANILRWLIWQKKRMEKAKKVEKKKMKKEKNLCVSEKQIDWKSALTKKNEENIKNNKEKTLLKLCVCSSATTDM